MESIVLTARVLMETLHDKPLSSITDNEQFAAVVVEQLLEYIEHLLERDAANEKRIALIKSLNEKYREHVITLIHTTDDLKEALAHLTESNFAKLQDPSIT
jgi:DNA repair ATPase RecN